MFDWVAFITVVLAAVAAGVVWRQARIAQGARSDAQMANEEARAILDEANRIQAELLDVEKRREEKMKELEAIPNLSLTVVPAKEWWLGVSYVIKNNGPGHALNVRVEGTDLLTPLVRRSDGEPLPPNSSRTYLSPSLSESKADSFLRDRSAGVRWKWEDIDGNEYALPLEV